MQILQVKNISKRYKTGELVQEALNRVSLNFRDNEFVSILGPSGSGKSTLLNIIGGLDRYDSGDLIINGISTKDYRDRNWDAYRNHTISFVSQSYNLIPYQTILAKVELALTIGGISRSERRRRAKNALEEVGLGDQLHKKPNQMSGGQMQRVAIARALGASKRNISQVFNTETVLIGFCAGVLGVSVSALLTIPINTLIERLLQTTTMTASLPLVSAVILVFLSMIVTVIGDLLPARNASPKDPVIALRTE